MTIEADLKTHIMAQLAVAYPDMDAKQAVVRFPKGQFVYGRNKARDCLGSEVLTARIQIDGGRNEPLDRTAFVRAFLRRHIRAGDVAVFQEYQRHDYIDNIEAIGTDRIIFYVDYTYNVYEES
jgi:hypothetical protein